MKNDCGAAAFDNVDELLAEKITSHSRHFAAADPNASVNKEVPPANHNHPSFVPSARYVPHWLCGLVITGVVLLILSVLLRQTIHRSTK